VANNTAFRFADAALVANEWSATSGNHLDISCYMVIIRTGRLRCGRDDGGLSAANLGHRSSCLLSFKAVGMQPAGATARTAHQIGARLVAVFAHRLAVEPAEKVLAVQLQDIFDHLLNGPVDGLFGLRRLSQATIRFRRYRR